MRTEPTADASLAAIRDRKRFGIAIAAMIKIIATTINNSISENPVCFLFSVLPVILASGKVKHTSQVGNHSRTNYMARFLSCNLLILKILVLL